MRAVSLTNRGGRKTNEDCIGHANVGEAWCFVVCDGLGGQSCGEVASSLVCGAVLEEFKKNPEISGKALYRCIEKAASLLGEEREENPEKSDMATTIAVLATDGKNAVWTHAGDSRMYVLSGKKISYVTDDHSLAFAEYLIGDITYDDISKSPNQNKLTNSISDLSGLYLDISDVTPMHKGDAFLLCTDGFWEYVDKGSIERAYRLSSSPKEWLERMLAILHENETETNDNYSVIAIML